MALKYNNNQINKVFWNSAQTITNINKTYSGSTKSSTTAISGTYHWSGSITTDIKTNDISSLRASATSSSAWVASIGNPSLSIDSGGYVVISVGGTANMSGKTVSYNVAITGFCTT
jgi:tRNA threonylcarbamoyladenosine modification (KEOPS) complex  Pcc1 subunit